VNPRVPATEPESPSIGGGDEILTDEHGNITIGVPTAVAIVEIPHEDEESD
jgi:hypothetical protein